MEETNLFNKTNTEILYKICEKNVYDYVAEILNQVTLPKVFTISEKVRVLDTLTNNFDADDVEEIKYPSEIKDIGDLTKFKNLKVIDLTKCYNFNNFELKRLFNIKDDIIIKIPSHISSIEINNLTILIKNPIYTEDDNTNLNRVHNISFMKELQEIYLRLNKKYCINNMFYITSFKQDELYSESLYLSTEEDVNEILIDVAKFINFTGIVLYQIEVESYIVFIFENGQLLTILTKNYSLDENLNKINYEATLNNASKLLTYKCSKNTNTEPLNIVGFYLENSWWYLARSEQEPLKVNKLIVNWKKDFTDLDVYVTYYDKNYFNNNLTYDDKSEPSIGDIINYNDELYCIISIDKKEKFENWGYNRTYYLIKYEKIVSGMIIETYDKQVEIKGISLAVFGKTPYRPFNVKTKQVFIIENEN